jgi:hypothetical protein
MDHRDATHFLRLRDELHLALEPITFSCVGYERPSRIL